MAHTAQTKIFVPCTRELRFAAMMELTTGEQWAYAFTSEAKAKDFMRLMRRDGLLKEIDRVFPCTLGEWFELKVKKGWPDLTIDPDAQQIKDYTKKLVTDFEKENVQCLTIDRPGGTFYQVKTSPRTDSAK